jgi:hypothetical protein
MFLSHQTFISVVVYSPSTKHVRPDDSNQSYKYTRFFELLNQRWYIRYCVTQPRRLPPYPCLSIWTRNRPYALWQSIVSVIVHPFAKAIIGPSVIAGQPHPQRPPEHPYPLPRPHLHPAPRLPPQTPSPSSTASTYPSSGPFALPATAPAPLQSVP